MINLETAILIIGIVQGIFLSLTLAVKSSGNHGANRLLVLLLLSFVVALAAQLGFVSGFAEMTKPLFVLATSVVFLFGPLLYFYVQKITFSMTTFSIRRLIHFIPFSCYLFLALYTVWFGNVDMRILNEHSVKDFSITQLLMPLFKLAHVVCYTAVSLVLLIKYRQRIRNSFSNLDNINLLWLRNLVIGFILFELMLVMALIFDLSAFTLVSNADTFLSFVLVLLIFMTGFYGTHQPSIIEPPFQAEASSKPAFLPGNNLIGSGQKNLKPEDLNVIKPKLEQLMASSIYLDRFLSLKNLSDAVGVSQHKMSEYLNEHLSMTFYEYINRARIEDAKQQLIDSQKSILDIALDVGFNNKATFNKTFKSVESITPSEFRRNKIEVTE